MTKAGGQAVPQALDAAGMEAVMGYIESERTRNRRILFWTSSVFLLIVFLILITSLSIGIFVLRNSRKATDIVSDVQARTAVYAAEVVGMSNKINSLENRQTGIKSFVDDREANREWKDKLLRADLKRFSGWVASRSSGEPKAVARLESRLKKIEQTSAARERELLALVQEYSNLVVLAQSASTRIEPVPTVQVEATAPPVLEGAPLQPEPFRAEAVEAASSAAVARATASWLQPPEPRGEIFTVSFPNGDKYRGEFKNGLFHGWGRYAYRNGDVYDGEFANDLKQGRGTMTYANGNRYKGEFKDGLKHGNGVFRFANGDVYEGQFRNDLRHGLGTYVFGNGEKFVGEFREGKMAGQGRYVYKGGEEYVGEFKNGEKNGRGLCRYPDGRVLKGIWRQDRFVEALEK